VPRSIRCEAGLGWEWDGVAFSVLHPPAEGDDRREARGNARPRRKENDRSCVLRVTAGGASALLTGDVERRGEAEMLARDAAALRADVLLVPHHGSRSSSTAPFLDAVSPRVALVSAAYRNRFGHPHSNVLTRYAQRGIAVHRTDAQGALRVVLPHAATLGIEVSGHAWHRRYWSEHPRAPASAQPPRGGAPAVRY
jgi:competence protein ComEC